MNRKPEDRGNRRLMWFVSLSLLMALMLAAVGYTHRFAVTASGESQTATQVDIEAAPSDASANTKKPTSRRISVTVFSSSSFDATTLMASTMSFKDAISLEGAVGATSVSVRDVNRDQHPDLVAEFSVPAINKMPTKMILEGRTNGGTVIQGSTCIQASGVPCGGTIFGAANHVEDGKGVSPGGPQGQVSCDENFDAVTAPALPAAWTATTATDCVNSNPWETSTAGTPAPPADTAPNAAFVNDPNCISDERLDSLSFSINSSSAVLSFRHNRNLENGFDGTVLEVSINGGAFQDILATTATFGTNGYNGVISVNFGSPIGGRNAWTGNSAGFVTTTVNLPASANGQQWVFRWRRASDSSVSGQGFRLDTLSLSGANCGLGECGLVCPANITQTNDPGQCGAVVNYPSPTTSGQCGTISCSPPSGSFFPVGTTTVTCTEDVVIVGSPSGIGASCSFTVTVTDDQPPSITCPANITTSNDPGQCGAVVNYPPPTITDNCPGTFTATCNPPSGSFFPVGTTTVTCEVDGFGGGDSTPNGACQNPATITHSTSQTVILGNSVACFDQINGTTTDNSYWRAFSLPAFSINTIFDVQSVDIGIDEAISGGGGKQGKRHTAISRNPKKGKGKTNAPGGGQPLTIRLYTNSGGAFPAGTRTQIATQDYTIPDQAATVVNLPIAVSVPAGSELVVEIFTPDGLADGNAFFIGSNDSPETGPSYISAPDCGIVNPTPTAALGFPDMHIVMNVNGCAQPAPPGGGGPSCTFTVTVNDTQPPQITCPANVTAITDQNACPAPACQIVNFPAVVATDNCPLPPGAVVCNPPSGSCFPVGVTTVTCTATDASGNTATCSFTVSTFDTALEDDSDPSIILVWNSITGQYRFCCNGVTYTGVGTSTIQGCVYTLQHNPADRRVLGRVDKAVHAGSASIQAPAGITRCTITDRNTLNDPLTPPCQ